MSKIQLCQRYKGRVSATSIDNILRSNKNNLNSLLNQIYKQRVLTNFIHKFVGHPLNQHIHLGTVTSKSIVLITFSSAWLTRIRFRLPEILTHIGTLSQYSNVRSIHIKVSPLINYNQNTQTHSIKMSQKASTFINNAAQSFENQDIKQALYRLAQNSKQADNSS